MKRIALLSLCLMVLAGIVSAQGGYLGIFSDTRGCVCGVNNLAGYMQVHVVHIDAVGVTASQFAVQVIGTHLSNVGEISPYPTIGNSSTGMAVNYGACLESPIHVLTITYMGISNHCDLIEIVADPTAPLPGIYTTDCVTPVPNLLTIPGMRTYINEGVAWGCYTCSPYYAPPWCAIPIEETSWGQIKKIYR